MLKRLGKQPDKSFEKKVETIASKSPGISNEAHSRIFDNVFKELQLSREQSLTDTGTDKDMGGTRSSGPDLLDM